MTDLINKILRSISKGKNIATRLTLILLTTVISTQDMSNTESWNTTCERAEISYWKGVRVSQSSTKKYWLREIHLIQFPYDVTKAVLSVYQC